MPEAHPITQRDVALACGLHPSTVCLALKNAPSIPEATRHRIQAIAEQLGYQPNVAARNLALLRTEKKSAAALPIAWINQEARRDYWRTEPEAREAFEHARRRAAELGYHLEEIWTRETGMNTARVTQILRARGIEGVIFPAHGSFDFSLLQGDWGDFALVGMNDHRLGEWVDVVCSDHYGNTGLAWRRLRQLGLERIGLVLSAQFDAATSGLVHARFLREQAELPPSLRLPVCFTSADHRHTVAAVADWLREQRPDIVLGHDPALCRRTMFVHVRSGVGEFAAGVDAALGDVARAAVERVVEKMRRFERGARDSGCVHLVKGTWHERALVVREPASVVA